LVAVFIRPRQLPTIATAAAGALLGPIAWNAILRATHVTNFFHDAPITVLPASWQDTGSGVFTIALTAMALGFGPLSGAGTGRRLAVAATLSGLAAFLVDVYLY
jgi:ABC-type nitrate/sulfonate/bicarbonate transport system permease component